MIIIIIVIVIFIIVIIIIIMTVHKIQCFVCILLLQLHIPVNFTFRTSLCISEE